ncbi:MAG: fasciclin domain-containing protein [Planctomycetota bacterium]
MRHLLSLILALGLATTLSAQCGGDAKPVTKPIVEKDIIGTAHAAGRFETLIAAVEAAGLTEALGGKGPFTVFAPTDAAFARLPDGTVESLLKPENRGRLAEILKFHVVPGRVLADAAVKLDGAVTLQGQRLAISVGEGGVHVDGAKVVKTDVLARNGVIHVIDSVIMPETRNLVEVAAGAGTFKTLLAAAKAAGLAEVLAGPGPFTVFAPTDEAFAKLAPGTVESLLEPANRERLAAILKYHVVSGRHHSDAVLAARSLKTLQGGAIAVSSSERGVRIGEAALTAADIDASNAVIHVIDRVLLPPKH